ncbi:MAG: TetR/AcrR family transcriptional regulator [Mycobacterium sp.]
MGKREETRARIEAQIVEIGRRHLVTEGAAGLSLRAVARDLGMVSSAVYRYVASRDELLTLLVVDAYNELAATADEARRSAPGWRDDIAAVASAARRWAVGNPASWALLYGSPVPDYQAPPARTVGPGTRVVAALFDAVAAGIAAGEVPNPDSVAAQPLSCDYGRIRAKFDFIGGDDTVTKCFLLWAAIIGAISMEVFGQYGSDTLTQPESVFSAQVRLLVDMLTR